MGRWPAAWPARAYMIGIGGAAMSGLAGLLAGRGVHVAGSDGAVYPPASEMLASAGIVVKTPYAAENLDERAELVVVGNAISRGNPELERALDTDLSIASMSEVVERLLVPERRVSAVAGTHGKTTTASLLAWIHESAGRAPSFLIGGRPGNFESGARWGEGEDLVLEADEYDTAFFDKGPKFLHSWPRIAVLGPVEFDHADIYRDAADVERAFELYLRLVPRSGTLVVHADDPVAGRLAREARARVVEVGLEPGCVWRAVERRDGESSQSFVLEVEGARIGGGRLPLPGAHNARNALAAMAAAAAAGVPAAASLEALARFEPPRRRLELIGRGTLGRAYDDFAHHPTAIAETLATLRRGLPEGARLVACVEPRSNTMVRRHVEPALEEALATADRVLIAPVDRPERFTPEERLDVAALAAALRGRGLEAEGPLEPDAILERLLEGGRKQDRVVVMSNGAFGGLPGKLARALGKQEREA